jgi:hypothetical protein
MVAILIRSACGFEPRFLMYLKLFFGMGFIWCFEIVAGLANDDIHESSWCVR